MIRTDGSPFDEKEFNRMVRHRLTDEQWDLIADLFPSPKATGRPPRDRRVILDGIFWILRTGAQATPVETPPAPPS